MTATASSSALPPERPPERSPHRPPAGSRASRPALVAVAVVLALLVSGCAGLSTDSAVTPGLRVGVDQGDSVRIVPPDPIPGASPEEIVRGFIRGGAASDGVYDTARSFLSRYTPPDWRPDTSVTLFESVAGLSIAATGDDTVRVTAPVTATIDAEGRYTETPGVTATADFTLENSSGEWRISSVPSTFGTWLGSFEADLLLRPHTVNYVSTSGRRLVPDVRWFASGKGLVTRLARAQLGAVPEYLAGSVLSAVPSGTVLEVDAVPVENGVATVDLGPSTLGTDTVTRQNLWAQFYATLSQAPGVNRISLRQGGAELALPGVEGPVGSLSAIDFPVPPARADATALVRTGTLLRPIDPEQLGEDGLEAPTEGRDDLPVIGTGWGALALSLDGSEIAGVGQSRTEATRWVGTNQLSLPEIGSELVPPTYDLLDMLWLAGRDADGTGRVWAIDTRTDPTDGAGAEPQPVEAPWLADRRVVALRVSADGTRAAVISTDVDGDGSRVDVTGVERGPDNVPVSLSTPLRTAMRLDTALDLVWVGPTTLAVIGTSGSGAATPWVVDIGGPSEALPEVPGARTITTVSGERALIVTTDQDEILIRAGSSWLRIGDGSTLLAPAT